MDISFDEIEAERFNQQARLFARPPKHASTFGYFSRAELRAAEIYLLDTAVRTESDVERTLERFRKLRDTGEGGPSDLSTNYESY